MKKAKKAKKAVKHKAKKAKLKVKAVRYKAVKKIKIKKHKKIEKKKLVKHKIAEEKKLVHEIPPRITVQPKPSKQPKVLVLRTAGTNCDYETVNAFQKAGSLVELVHVNKLIRREIELSDFHLLAIPGGFSHGDYLGSGKILANKILYRLNNLVPDFVKQGNLVIGICNGFQILVKAGLLPGFNQNYRQQLMTLTFNASGNFQDEWVVLNNMNKGKCIWSSGIRKPLHAPIAHAEGRLDLNDSELLKRLYANDQIVFKYERNPNGSIDSIAGVCDETGRIFGLMPHPERNTSFLNDPRSTRIELPAEGEGMQVIRNGVEFARKKLL
ncbi:MAG: phosphoribosylformylglycinamidine synthase I [Candidatus Diapherotrites archaeon]